MCVVDFSFAERNRIKIKKEVREQFKKLELRGGKSESEKKYNELQKELENMEKRKKAAVIEFIKNLCDYPVCKYFIDEKSFTPMFIYFTGTWSSIIAWYQAWR